MDLFQRAKAVRLRSHNEMYLLAEDDEELCQNRNGTTWKAQWQVELLDEGQPLIRLKSCFGKYLSASNEPLLHGVTRRRFFQAALGHRLDSSLEWESVRDGFQVKLKTRYGHFLRVNGGPPPWRNTVTHDILHLHMIEFSGRMILWRCNSLETGAEME
ncbi:uncharacterized protein LOC110030003 [Phalaenopsis equestris]|uniref:uncharacterized protein LOC110030003 n=1 Tax=Phalaenopsis equestris TaxID=78828 RepID=UPI0009E45796|nr:uncharacterized protein LOC110030003 [Phalaenopsis equestris]